jgi:hypothetical protein
MSPANLGVDRDAKEINDIYAELAPEYLVGTYGLRLEKKSLSIWNFQAILGGSAHPLRRHPDRDGQNCRLRYFSRHA